ncbi:MAG: hydrogenase expression/formation protein HypE [Desulfobacterota bacterium]|nr:hydrogenase expression/formation protein HypE [Thermodesulfobacteriota bacterium]MDW8001521.1 hydrogenase expression/formation protein HypE [Deltaproteobacteria bacterium]
MKTKDVILLSHGDGGLLTHELLEQYFLPYIGNELLLQMDDATAVDLKSEKIVITTDSYVVDPIFFPGGDIGKLSVFGTVNDLSVSGAKPLYIAASFIMEEGLELEILEKIVISMSYACKEANVSIIAGDTKVVGRNQVDKIFITTTGIGVRLNGVRLGKMYIEPDDSIIVSGPLGNHGLCILLERGNFNFRTKIVSDCAPLNGVIERILKEFKKVKYMRDLTRGGLATCLKEIASSIGSVDFLLEEADIPIDEEVKGICETLGLDPLYLANEGKFVLFIGRDEAQSVLNFMRDELGLKGASKIGVVREGSGNVFMKTLIGGTRRLNMLSGTPLPRIC